VGWSVERVAATAAEVHGLPFPDPVTRAVRVVDVTAPALVLGSTQPHVAAAGIDVVRRRSGGGAVLVRPGDVVWVDVFVPAGDPLSQDDVGRAFHWLGRAWTTALATLGIDARWHDGPLVCTPWCRQVCFAGLGPGEVTVAGRKVVGLAQRRTRAGALFQCAALRRWEPQDLVDLLGLDADAAAELPSLATGLDVPAADLEQAFVAGVTAFGGDLRPLE
jgi:lipoate---protein ligase